MEDTALLLRKYSDAGKALSDNEIMDLLNKSKIVQKLTGDYEENRLFNIFRLICMSEIPYISRLSYVQAVISYVSEHVATMAGFSYTGDISYVVPCYNAMLLEAYVRLGLTESPEAETALAWIKRYQVFERGEITDWKYNGICKHGGCMNAVPCYIGIGKTVRALITYSEFTHGRDREADELIDRGTAYMLKHHMFKRLSNQQPISRHITDMMFPQAYMLSLTDLAYIADRQELWDDVRTTALKELLNEKMVQPGQWKIDYIYGHKGYKSFETRRYPSAWMEHLIRFDRRDLHE